MLIDRIPQGQSPFKGRSYCDKCKKTLRWYDLIPILSFVFIRGKCRYCHFPISFYYPLVELLTGLMFVFVYFYFLKVDLLFTIYDLRFLANYLYYLFILSSFIIVFFTDLKYGIIPDVILYPAIAVTAIFNFQLSIINYSLSGLGAFLFLLSLYLLTRGKGMGFGDVKLAFLKGLFLGFPKIVAALYIAFLTGAIVGLILIIWKKKRLLGSTIPFGPFLVLGTILSLFLGEKIVQLVLP